MSEHVHTWVHRHMLGGAIIERCLTCRRARVPRLSAEEAQTNDLDAMQAMFKQVYAGKVADLIPRASTALWPWGTRHA